MNQEVLLAELKRRQRLWSTLDAYILTKLASDARARLNRGQTQDRIIQDLGLKNTGYNRREINERMEHLGFPPIVVQGTFYYKGIRWP